jgi:pimeloyl-ACP methyl ester carboxylesterase
MAMITLPHGAVHYRPHGPDDATAPPVVFVHGILVGATLWSGVAEALAAQGVRSFAPDLPLGSHRVPVGADADQSPRGVARQVIAFIEALDLHDVTLVGNDTGGAICQYLLDTDASRIGRLVLTNCDAFEQFPPPSLRRFIELVTRPAALAGAAQAMRATRFRHGRFGFGPFANSFDADMTAAWVEPARTDERVRDDLVRFARAIDPDDLVAVGGRLNAFAGPVRLVWGTADPYFTLDLARRIQAAFTDASLVEVDGARTFVALDAPDVVAEEIVSLTQEGRRRAAS